MYIHCNKWVMEAIHVRKEQDKSTNRDEGSYQLTHVYDYFLSAAATSGGQSFRRRQQQLSKRQQVSNQKLFFDAHN